jgi:hypothetical protein
LLPRARLTLERLMADAVSEGQREQAELYRLGRERLR